MANAQFDLDRALVELARNGAPALAVQNQLVSLGQLSRQIGQANPATLAALNGAVIAAVASAQDAGREAAALAGSNDPASAAMTLAVASAKTRATVQDDMRAIYDRKIFDPYLRFANAEDEEAYRHREEETRRAIEKALAQHTPQGDLLATKLMDRQLADAGAHGADASPEFAGRVARNRQNMVDLEKTIGDERTPPAKNDELRAGADRSASDAQLASIAATLNAAGVGGGTTIDAPGSNPTPSAAPERSRSSRA